MLLQGGLPSLTEGVHGVGSMTAWRTLCAHGETFGKVIRVDPGQREFTTVVLFVAAGCAATSGGSSGSTV